MAHRVHLNHELDIELLVLAHCNQAIENAFPILVAREIVIRDEEAVDSLRQIAPHDLLYLIRRAPP